MVDIPGNTTSKAVLDTQDASLGTFSGQFETFGDHDFIRLSLLGGQTYRIYFETLETGSLTTGNGSIEVRDANGSPKLGLLGFAEVKANFTPAADGTFFLDVSENSRDHTGDYVVVVTLGGTADSVKTSGNDTVTGSVSNERILGGRGADTLTLVSNAGSDAFGQQGNDILIGDASGNILVGGLGNDSLFGNAGTDHLFGNSGNDDIFGGDNVDFIRGGDGNDNLNGDDGNDFLFGGAGKDFLTGGDNSGGADTFVFSARSDSKPGATRDVITDFSNPEVDHDIIDLHSIDAKKQGGTDDTFTFIGAQHFHHKEGELRFTVDTAHDRTIIQGDVNGDAKADIEIELTGTFSGIDALHAFHFAL
jgi:Ca2+-binding RTX toxin-like protein